MNGIDLIAEERRRQLKELGFDADRDARYTGSELVRAAIHYAEPDVGLGQLVFALGCGSPDLFEVWPREWDRSWDKKGQGTRIRDLAKAGALIAAEIDRLQSDR